MICCCICRKEVKSISRHVWKTHGSGINHKPFTGKTLIPWNKGKTNASAAARAVYDARRGKRLGSFSSHSDRTKRSIAEKMRGNRNANHRGRRCTYDGFTFKSSWELAVARHLDQSGMVWIYEERAFVIDDRRSYRPDFFVYDGDDLAKIIEVKGYWRPANLEKFERFRLLYPYLEIEVWDKRKLKALGLI